MEQLSALTPITSIIPVLKLNQHILPSFFLNSILPFFPANRILKAREWFKNKEFSPWFYYTGFTQNWNVICRCLFIIWDESKRPVQLSKQEASSSKSYGGSSLSSWIGCLSFPSTFGQSNLTLLSNLSPERKYKTCSWPLPDLGEETYRDNKNGPLIRNYCGA